MKVKLVFKNESIFNYTKSFTKLRSIFTMDYYKITSIITMLIFINAVCFSFNLQIIDNKNINNLTYSNFVTFYKKKKKIRYLIF